jgi:hypothetical protein
MTAFGSNADNLVGWAYQQTCQWSDYAQPEATPHPSDGDRQRLAEEAARIGKQKMAAIDLGPKAEKSFSAATRKGREFSIKIKAHTWELIEIARVSPSAANLQPVSDVNGE